MSPRPAGLFRRPAITLAAIGLFVACAPVPGVLASTSSVAELAAPKAGLAIMVTTRTIQPKVRQTVGFTGYASYTFLAPKGRRIVSASARIVGGEAHALRIRGRAISQNRTRYTVSLVFPGEQGTPGELVVRLGTVA
jgi:hypothetical protein